MKWKKKRLTCNVFYCVLVSVCRFTVFFFWLYCVTTVTPFIERSEGWSLRSVGVLDQSQQEYRFFSPKFKSAANFSAPAQEENLFFLSGRLAREKIHDLPIKSSHLWRTSRHVWLSSSTCDHCCAYQLICIMTISTYTTGASTRFFTVPWPSWRVISSLSPVV